MSLLTTAGKTNLLTTIPLINKKAVQLKYLDQHITLPPQTSPPISKNRKINCFKNLNKFSISHKDNNGPTPECAQKDYGVKAMSRDKHPTNSL